MTESDIVVWGALALVWLDLVWIYLAGLCVSPGWIWFGFSSLLVLIIEPGLAPRPARKIGLALFGFDNRTGASAKAD